MRRRAASASLTLALLASGPAYAQAVGLTSYEPEFFAQFSPSSAADMVGRLPGFTLNGGASVRGLAGSAGNVLIDGERPSSKTSINDVLRRITAGNVERIDVIRGQAAGVDMQGHSVVANVIRKPGADSALITEAWVRLYENRRPGAQVRVEAARRAGALSLEGTFQAFQQREQAQTGFLRRTGAEVREGPYRHDGERSFVQALGALEYRRDADVFRLNALGETNKHPRIEGWSLTNPSGHVFTETADVSHYNDRIDLGADYERAMAWAGSARLTGLYSVRTTEGGTAYTAASPSGESQSDSRSREVATEAILRGVLGGDLFGVALEGGGEVAINTLDAASTLLIGGAPVQLPSADVTVEEERAEAFLTGTAVLSGVSIDLGLRMETSTLSQSGDVSKSRTFAFPKPRALFSFAFDERTQLRLRVERTVSQLSFGDFAASSDLAGGQHVAGNADLEPERAWVMEAALDRQFWDSGALALTLVHQDIEQVIDRIPIHGPDGSFDAPGNIGDGSRSEARVNLAVPLDPFGVDDAEVRLSGTWRWSEVLDPLTLESRRISYQRPFEGQVFVTKAVPAWRSVFGLDVYSLGWEQQNYQLKEVRLEREQPGADVYWDWTMKPGLELRVKLENLTGRSHARTRRQYLGVRTAEVLGGVEERRFDAASQLQLRLRKTW